MIRAALALLLLPQVATLLVRPRAGGLGVARLVVLQPPGPKVLLLLLLLYLLLEVLVA